jgi:hypothetical protein
MKQLTANDWDDVADLCEQAVSLVEESNGPNGLNSPLAHQKATQWMHSLAMKATGLAMDRREKERRMR